MREAKYELSRFLPVKEGAPRLPWGACGAGCRKSKILFLPSLHNFYESACGPTRRNPTWAAEAFTNRPGELFTGFHSLYLSNSHLFTVYLKKNLKKKC